MFRLHLKYLASSLLMTSIASLFCLPTIAAKPINVILDHDGGFEDYYSLLVLALASQKSNPPVKLLGVTTAPNGESYCNNSNGYPELKKELLGSFSTDEGTINGISQKILSIAGYNQAKIYTGCDERVATIAVPDEADEFGNPLPGSKKTRFRVQIPLGGKAALEPCLLHKEFVFSQRDLVCWNEFNRPFRDETLKYVLPKAQDALNEFQLPELNLINDKKKASTFLAESMCKAYKKQEKLTIVAVGPATNLARAYAKIKQAP